MPTLLILSSNADEYKQLIKSAQLPDLEFTTEPDNCDIVLGEPKLIRDTLPRLPNLKWVQAIYAGDRRIDGSRFTPRLHIDQRAGRVR